MAPPVSSSVPDVPRFSLIWLSVSLSIVSPFCNEISVVIPVEARLIPVVIDCVPEPMVMPLVIQPVMVFDVGEQTMRMASVTTVDPAAEVSALSKSKSEATALSVVLAVTWF